MSILNDDRKYGTEEEREEWKREVKDEYRRQEYFDNLRAEARAQEILTGYCDDE